MVLRCGDGREIPCVRYECLVSCEVLQHLAEDVTLHKDARGRAIVPFPNVDSADLATAIQVIHGITPPGELDASSAPAALRGLHALGHRTLVAPVMQQLWAVLSVSSTDLARDAEPHVNELLHTASVRLDVLRALVRACPTWREFSERVMPHVRMDLDLARWLLGHLVKFFPAGPVFLCVLDSVPTSVLTPESALSLFTPPGAVSYHPPEAMDVVRALADAMGGTQNTDTHNAQNTHNGSTEAWVPSVLEFMRAMLAATQVYDIAPHVANSLHGTIVLLDRTPSASVLLTTDRRGSVSRKLAPWLWLHADWGAGAVDVRISLDRMDDMARRARRCHVRLTAYANAESEEVWYVVSHVHPALEFWGVRDGQVAAGSADSFAGAVRKPTMTRLRIDLFYGEHSPLDRPMF